MQRGILFVFGLVSALWSGSASSATPGAGRFDGRWGVILVCPQAPDGALSWTVKFTANVKEAILHGEYGLAGRPGWLSLDGRIQPDGAAHLEARGVTGGAKYNIDQTAQGFPTRYDVTAHFDASRGTGNWVTTRTCDFTFTRQ